MSNMRRENLQKFYNLSNKAISISNSLITKVDYKNSQTKVIITCNTCHHIFEQTPYNHLRGKGCIKCSYKLLQ